jgi:hypothetical protein
VLANLIAGVQIALTQPIRLDDVVIVEGEWGVDRGHRRDLCRGAHLGLAPPRRAAEATSSRNPFENWTREGTSIIGAVTWHVDYSVPVETLRGKLIELVGPRRCGTVRW